jgi:hypothetical protein
VNKSLYPSICSIGTNGWGSANSLHEIGIISAVAFNFIVHEPSAIIVLFKAISLSSNFFKYLSISVSEWYELKTGCSKYFEVLNKFFGKLGKLTVGSSFLIDSAALKIFSNWFTL